MKIKLDKQNIFLLLLVMMILVARLLPFREEHLQYFDLKVFIDWGIAVIFLLYGLKLNVKEVINDVKNWKLHLLVQCSTFVFFPFLVFLFYEFSKNTEYYSIWLSVFFLASLPSTVSSSVVMVSIAKGNVTSAIFNASVSGLIGIVMTPLLMNAFLENKGDNVEEMEIVSQLFFKVLLPIVLGLIFNSFVKKWIVKYGKWINEFDRLIILLIVYESFSHAFTDDVFSSLSTSMFLVIAVASVALFFIVYEILRWLSRRLGFSRADTITATFCGSKKSLIHGSLFLIVFGISESQKVLFLVPVMFYHSFQLFYVSWLANRIGTKEIIKG